jgi:hypothetical protein
MAILLADSTDAGRTWTPWRTVPMPDDGGPPSLTNAILRLPSGRLVLSVETNKTYLDSSKWFQRVVYSWSDDDGTLWSPATTIVEDPTGRIANWDQRAGVAPDGRIVTFTWTYDFEAVAYRNIRRRISGDEGRTWSEPEDLGFADQPSHPAITPDGRIVLAWVDRFGSQSIRARSADAVDAPFQEATELVLYAHQVPRPSSTWAPGRTDWPMPKHCRTATLRSSTTLPASAAEPTSAGFACTPTEEAGRVRRQDPRLASRPTRCRRDALR